MADEHRDIDGRGEESSLRERRKNIAGKERRSGRSRTYNTVAQ
jgi:hypothetical protein